MLRVNGNIVGSVIPEIVQRVYLITSLDTYMTDATLTARVFKMPNANIYNFRLKFTPTASINNIPIQITTLVDKPTQDTIIPIGTTRGMSNNVLKLGTDGKLSFVNPDFPTCDIGEVHTVDFTYC